MGSPRCSSFPHKIGSAVLWGTPFGTFAAQKYTEIKVIATNNAEVVYRLLTNPMDYGESSKGNSLSIKNIKSRGVYPRFYTIIGVEILVLSWQNQYFVSESARCGRGSRWGNRLGCPSESADFVNALQRRRRLRSFGNMINCVVATFISIIYHRPGRERKPSTAKHGRGI